MPKKTRIKLKSHSSSGSGETSKPKQELEKEQVTLPEVTVTPAPPESTFPEAAEALSVEHAQAVEETAEPKRRRRRSNVKPEAPAISEEDKKSIETIQRVAVFAIDTLVKRMPNPAPLTEMEKEMLGDSAYNVLQKYFPKISGSAPEIALAATLGIIFIGRYEKKEEEEPKIE